MHGRRRRRAGFDSPRSPGPNDPASGAAGLLDCGRLRRIWMALAPASIPSLSTSTWNSTTRMLKGRGCAVRLRKPSTTRNRGVDRAKQRTLSCCDGQARDGTNCLRRLRPSARSGWSPADKACPLSLVQTSMAENARASAFRRLGRGRGGKRQNAAMSRHQELQLNLASWRRETPRATA